MYIVSEPAEAEVMSYIKYLDEVGKFGSNFKYSRCRSNT